MNTGSENNMIFMMQNYQSVFKNVHNYIEGLGWKGKATLRALADDLG